MVVGGRIRRLRQREEMTLYGLAEQIFRPDGGRYSAGFFSRLERGWASPPLWVYVVIAERFGVEPARLLGPDDAYKPVGEGEMTLVRTLRRVGMSPEEAIARLLGG
jgi:transcriptional regulator with XRE-family HTH domain